MSTGSCYAQCQGGECSVGGLGNLPLLCAASSALQWQQLHKLNIESREHLRTKSTISKFLFWSLLFVGQNLFWEDGTLQSDANIYKHNNQGLTLTFPVSLLSVQFISEINVVCAHTRACPTSQHRHGQYYICNVYIYTRMHWKNHMQIIAITGKLLLCFFLLTYIYICLNSALRTSAWAEAFLLCTFPSFCVQVMVIIMMHRYMLIMRNRCTHNNINEYEAGRGSWC